MRRAVIDIGTNTVKLLVADAGEQGIEAVYEADRPTRLGEGLQASGLLAAEPIARTSRAVQEFVAEARDRGADDCAAVATSAMRARVDITVEETPLLLQRSVVYNESSGLRLRPV